MPLKPVSTRTAARSSPATCPTFPPVDPPIVCRHSNTANNHQLQIGASYTENDRLSSARWPRRPHSTQNSAWNELATRGAHLRRPVRSSPAT
jgi:hypothetical protein